jgi:C4-dicarboxylate-specific signal transduction histidine kinase
MTEKLNTVGETGLQFFGKMSASISHELKNVLAIINENAGLLEDFCLMADRGIAFNPERLKKMSATVKNQISRADVILKCMNRFAHSVDATFTTVALNEVLELLLALTGRFAAARGVTVKSNLPPLPVRVHTSPYFLMNLGWRCLDFAMDAGGAQKVVELAVEDAADGARIKFRQLTGLTKAMLESFPGEREKSLLGLLAAEFTADVDRAEMVLNLKSTEVTTT